MIKIENYEVVGCEHALRGMRNPKNSWDRSDSGWRTDFEGGVYYEIGKNDRKLAMALAEGGPVHAKYRRMITVYVDITAPLYWWKEFDTYKVGTVANSCSTMHKIHDKAFFEEDFSFEKIEAAFEESGAANDVIHTAYVETQHLINALNRLRYAYNDTKNKKYWDAMIQLLPSSYNQKRTVMLNYEVLANMRRWRKNHKLDEWRKFCEWIDTLPYSELITTESKHTESVTSFSSFMDTFKGVRGIVRTEEEIEEYQKEIEKEYKRLFGREHDSTQV